MMRFEPSPSRARCRATLGSVTLAMRARRILSSRGITCEVIKISASENSRGCIYGIEYPCELSGSIQGMLSSAGLTRK
ncbi:MAG: DUF3343 domain-containing protein [Clostridia bacterium]|nr:DUF3343 domain-containing protein [Clostridia bacterium]